MAEPKITDFEEQNGLKVKEFYKYAYGEAVAYITRIYFVDKIGTFFDKTVVEYDEYELLTGNKLGKFQATTEKEIYNFKQTFPTKIEINK